MTTPRNGRDRLGKHVRSSLTGVAVVTPVDAYLAEQRSLTVVDAFARRHDEGRLEGRGRRYRDLVPLSAPGPGEQYAFEVDLDACSGCKACVTACHNLNGLDPTETWRTVGVLVASEEPVAPQHVTTACHHCLDPGCLKGCPAAAYEKDPLTGIVAHLDDQCIGCRYCELTCPYEVPVYSPARGIVRKCDLCRGRLAQGEAPACAQACPTGAIRVTLVDTTGITGEGVLVPGAPSSATTRPTTVYRTSRTLPDTPVERWPPRPAKPHPPLTVMLVLTQLAIGASLIGTAGGRVHTGNRALTALLVLLVGTIALGASVLHLGRPRHAWRAVLGLRTSWLSREILALGAFSVATAAHALALASDLRVADALGTAASATGAAAITCSAMIYAVTGRRWWRLRTTLARFSGTAVVCGAATVLAVTGREGLGALVAIATAIHVGSELLVLLHWHAGGDPELQRTARLLLGELRPLLGWRVGLAAVGALAALAARTGTMLFAAPAWLALVAGEMISRWLFFVAVAPARMPGAAP
ncbi:MAG: molybdopterin oxidoreductase [Acidimicrobiia bacterium]|nr:MAG: molybdopterin oxidoreductase [Acidimicrobiia bacterium]